MGPFEVESPIAVPSDEAPVAAAGGGGEPLRPPARGGISMRPAMVVLGLAALILAVFITIAIVTSQPPAAAKTSTAAGVVPGTAVRVVAAAGALTPIISSGQPLSNIINARTSRRAPCAAHQNNAGNSGQYDSQITVRSDESQGALLTFYSADLKWEGWQVFDRRPAANDPGATEVLGKLAGTTATTGRSG